MNRTFTAIILSSLLVMGCRAEERLTAFQNVHLVPMTEETILRNQTVLVEGDRIAAIGPANKLRIPTDARIIHGEGAYLMPGLADMHVHLTGNWPISQLDLYLANGVTTVRDLDGRDFMLKWREEIKAGKRSGPTLYVSRPIIYGYEKGAHELVSKQKAGYDCIKLYSYFSREDFKKAMQMAKKRNLYTVGHIPFAVGLDGIIAAGMDEIAHVEELSFELIDFDRARDLNPQTWLPYIIGNTIKQHRISAGFKAEDLTDDQKGRLSRVINKLKSAKLPVCTTMTIDDTAVQKLYQPDEFLARTESLYLPQKYREAFRQGKEKHQIQFKGNEELAPFKYSLDKMLLVELQRAGVPLVLGTDAGTGAMGIVPGFSIHNELRILVENGFSPYEAIASGTVNAAAVAGMMSGRNDFGTIEVGKRADVILVNKNPLEDISHIKDKRGVMAAGEWYDASYLQGIVNPALISGIPVIGSVMLVRQPDNSHTTGIEVIIGDNFDAQLPDDIDSITVTITDPNGLVTPLALPLPRFYEPFRDFWYRLDGRPALGKYTFRVSCRGLNGTATDFQTENKSLPIPDYETFSPAEGAILTSKTPTFSWAPVEYPAGEINYRLVIDDLTGKRIYGTARRQNMLSHTVSEGILKPGQTYRYRIRVMDSEDWVEVQNRSNSRWLTFTMSEVLE